MTRSRSRDQGLPDRAVERSGHPAPTRLRAPQDVTAASVGGIEYQVAKGAVRVAPEHVAALIERGFERID